MLRPGLHVVAIAIGFSVLRHPLPLLLPLPLQGQRAAPDSALLSRYHDTLMALRDTLDGVSAAAWEFGRDLRRAGRETVLGRAARLEERCRAAALTLSEAEPTFRPSSAPAAARRDAANLRLAIRRLRVVLREQCENGFRRDGPGDRADTLRAWGPYRSGEIAKAVRQYEAAAAQFAAKVGVKLGPKLPARRDPKG